MTRPVLIDTDTGVDDALALILALRSPELSVQAITTVAGNVGVRHCTRNVLYLLNLLQRQDVPVCQGAAQPLRRRLFTAPEVHGADGLGNTRPHVRIPRTLPRNADRFIVEMSKRYGKRLTIIALGPLTNIARALRKHPSMLRSIGSLITMGGAFRVPGNTGPVAEFNYYVDPEAAHLVLNDRLPVTVIPLDVTEQVVLMRREMEAFRRASPLARQILRFTKFYMHYHRTHEGFYGGYLHDPIAVAAALYPDLIETRPACVLVERCGEWTRGMTVADLRVKPRVDCPSVQVAFKIDRERFLRLFHERMWT
jgi:purine nucleosidase/pyrimidine-specific ribonucleoside hydrolase